jgi:peptidyl-prolyl cis-trans isomerase B (cyclophilin B)
MSTTVKFTTNLGSFELELDEKKAPITVANFVQYVTEGHFADTLFHRVIPGFMIQGGGFDVKREQKPTRAQIDNEAMNGLRNDHYTVAMARTSDPHSATAQFFINTANNDFLNYKAANAQGWGYCVFGRVSAGTDVVDRMGQVKTSRNGPHSDWPTDDVVIQSAQVL